MDEAPNNSHEERMRRIAALLLPSEKSPADWGELSHLDEKPCTKKIANKFLICCLLDWQMKSDLAWKNGKRLVEEILDDPDDVWKAITSVSESEWASRRDQYKLHRFPAGHTRLWSIAWHIGDNYEADARRIWAGKEPADVFRRLSVLGAGEQLSRMIVGALRDCGQLEGAASDVKADVHVCRVLGRVVCGEPVKPETAGQLTRELHLADPWRLDWPLWEIGTSFCHSRRPNCPKCSLAPECSYALKASLQSSAV
jgi:endonuclease III